MITAAAMLLPCMPQLMPRVSAAGELTEISTQEQLAQLASEVNNGTTYEGKTIKLTANITLSGSWTPIGVYSESKPFKGTFNGQGHTISGLSITSGDNVGLFGYVYSGYQETAAVKNLTVTGSITATGNAGGIVAYLDGGNSTVSCCHSDVNITGTGGKSSAVGGIVGNNASGIVTNCYSTGTVSAAYNVGGVVGWNASGTVSYCHYYNSSLDCLRITSGQAIGAIIGENDGTVTSCRFLYGTAENGIGKYQGVEHQTTEVKSLDAEEFKDSSSISTKFPGWNFTRIWCYNEDGSYPVLQFNPYVELTNHIETVEQLVLLRDAVNAGNAIVNAYDTYYLDKDLDLSSIDNWEPIGTEDHPFTKTFTSCDEHGSGIRTISGLTITGTDSNRGLFGYNSGTINNLTLSGCNVSGGTNVGCLVGQNNGTIQNVTVAGAVTGSGDNVDGIAGSTTAAISGCTNNSTVTGTGDNVGGIAGSTTAEISGCTNNATVTGSGNNVGGIVGCSNIISSNNNISYCINIGTVNGVVSNSGSNITGSDSIGGIVGYNEKGTVTRCHTTKSSLVKDGTNVGGIVGKNEGKVQLCYNSGIIKSKDDLSKSVNAGGVVGSNLKDAVIENCYNTADVRGYIVGGVLGINYGKIINCYSNGSAYGSYWRGGVVGSNETDGSISSCYFCEIKDTTYNLNYVADNKQGTIDNYSRYLTASEFIDETNFINWDFNDTSIWTISKNEAKAPVFFELKLTRDDGDIETGYYTDAEGTYYKDATAFVVTLTCGDVAATPYVSGSITVGNKTEKYEKKLTTEISGKGSVNIGIVLTGIAADDAVLKAQAMIE